MKCIAPNLSQVLWGLSRTFLHYFCCDRLVNMDVADDSGERIRSFLKHSAETLQNEVLDNLRPMFPHLGENTIKDIIIHQSMLLNGSHDQTRLTNSCVDVLLETGTNPQDYIDLTQFEDSSAVLGLNLTSNIPDDTHVDSAPFVDLITNASSLNSTNKSSLNLVSSTSPLSNALISKAHPKRTDISNNSLESVSCDLQQLPTVGSVTTSNAVSTPVRSQSDFLKTTPLGSGNVHPTATPVRSQPEFLKTTPLGSGNVHPTATPVRSQPEFLKTTPLGSGNVHSTATPVRSQPDFLKTTPLGSGNVHSTATPVRSQPDFLKTTPLGSGNVHPTATPVRSQPDFLKTTPLGSGNVHPTATPVRSQPEFLKTTPLGSGNVRPTAANKPYMRSPDNHTNTDGQHRRAKSSKAPSTMSRCPCDDCKTNPSSHGHHNSSPSHNGHRARHQSTPTPGGHSSLSILASTQASGSIGESGLLQSTSQLGSISTGASSNTTPTGSTVPRRASAGTSSAKMPADSKKPPVQKSSPEKNLIHAELNRLNEALLKLTKMSKTPRKATVLQRPGTAKQTSSPVTTTSVPVTSNTTSLSKPGFQKASTLVASNPVNIQPETAQVSANTNSLSVSNKPNTSDVNRTRTLNPGTACTTSPTNPGNTGLVQERASCRYATSSSTAGPLLPPASSTLDSSGIDSAGAAASSQNPGIHSRPGQSAFTAPSSTKLQSLSKPTTVGQLSRQKTSPNQAAVDRPDSAPRTTAPSVRPAVPTCQTAAASTSVSISSAPAAQLAMCGNPAPLQGAAQPEPPIPFGHVKQPLQTVNQPSANCTHPSLGRIGQPEHYARAYPSPFTPKACVSQNLTQRYVPRPQGPIPQPKPVVQLIPKISKVIGHLPQPPVQAQSAVMQLLPVGTWPAKEHMVPLTKAYQHQPSISAQAQPAPTPTMPQPPAQAQPAMVHQQPTRAQAQAQPAMAQPAMVHQPPTQAQAPPAMAQPNMAHQPPTRTQAPPAQAQKAMAHQPPTRTQAQARPAMAQPNMAHQPPTRPRTQTQAQPAMVHQPPTQTQPQVPPAQAQPAMMYQPPTRPQTQAQAQPAMMHQPPTRPQTQVQAQPAVVHQPPTQARAPPAMARPAMAHQPPTQTQPQAPPAMAQPARMHQPSTRPQAPPAMARPAMAHQPPTQTQPQAPPAMAQPARMHQDQPAMVDLLQMIPAMLQQPPIIPAMLQQPPQAALPDHPPVTIHNFDLMAAEVLAMFPDVEPDYVLTKLREFQDHPSPAHLMCNHLLESENYPKVKKPDLPKAASPKDQESWDKADYVNDYFKITSTSRYHVVMGQLQNVFKMLSVDTIKQVFNLHFCHYAPTRVCLEEILRTNETLRQVVTQPKSVAFDKRKVYVEITTKDKRGKAVKTTIPIQVLKGRRSVMSGKAEDRELLNQINSYKEYTKNSAVEKDLIFAQSMNENEYEAEGQLIECGCCYTEVPFENMVQCLDGHLFCSTCLQSYAQQAVYGQGKALLMCMTDGCDSSYPRVQLEKCLTSKDLMKYDERVQEESIQLADIEGFVKCPSCDFGALLDPGDKVFKCQKSSCMKESCRHCGEDWAEHFGKRCEEMEKKTETNLRLSFEERMSQAQIRTCHKCKTGIMKDQGCNKMTCRCGAKMCYICRKPKIDYNHFCSHARNPGQGCTTCVKCSLWTDPAEDDARAVKELEKELQVAKEKMNQGKGSHEVSSSTHLDGPEAKRQRVV